MLIAKDSTTKSECHCGKLQGCVHLQGGGEERGGRGGRGGEGREGRRGEGRGGRRGCKLQVVLCWCVHATLLIGEGVIWSVERWMSQYLDHVLCRERKRRMQLDTGTR